MPRLRGVVGKHTVTSIVVAECCQFALQSIFSFLKHDCVCIPSPFRSIPLSFSSDDSTFDSDNCIFPFGVSPVVSSSVCSRFISPNTCCPHTTCLQPVLLNILSPQSQLGIRIGKKKTSHVSLVLLLYSIIRAQGSIIRIHRGRASLTNWCLKFHQVRFLITDMAGNKLSLHCFTYHPFSKNHGFTIRYDAEKRHQTSFMYKQLFPHLRPSITQMETALFVFIMYVLKSYSQIKK